MNFELKVGDKLSHFIALYRSPSQTRDQLTSETSELTLEKLPENKSYLPVAIGDFNARIRHWYSQETNSFEGNLVKSVASQFELHQIIKEPTYILENSF